MNIDDDADPNIPMETMRSKKLMEKKNKKAKPSRGGGGGFGSK